MGESAWDIIKEFKIIISNKIISREELDGFNLDNKKLSEKIDKLINLSII